MTLAMAFLLSAITAPRVQAQTWTYNPLYAFQGGSDGETASGSLVRDASGSLYGTTVNGGAYSRGTVFKLAANGMETVLYSFTGAGGDGAVPYGRVVRDANGNLYGTTVAGGAAGYGTVFKLAPSGVETVLYSFKGGSDGLNSSGGLVKDAQGNLYGTTSFGGATDCGTVFKVDPSGNETVLYSFTGMDGAQPEGGLFRDTAGNLYGTAGGGGTFGSGAIFEITAAGAETVLYSFVPGGPDGVSPQSGVVSDSQGNLYGATAYGGASGNGAVFKLDNSGNETILYSFPPSVGGFYPSPTGLILDAAGNLYGITNDGGAYGYGSLFKLDPTGNETDLYSFIGGSDGANPNGGLIGDADGNLYGAVYRGGSSAYPYGNGIVFEVVSPGSLCKTVGAVCADGSIFAGITPDGNAPMYSQRCDYGRSWNGSNCVGMWSYILWSVGDSILTGFSDPTAGETNTAALAALSNADGPYAAAQYCESLNENGHQDWYVPSLNELNVIYQNEAAMVGFSSTDTYWSSTEFSTDSASGQYFGNGGQYSYAKNTVGILVHCVRK